jgi:hypothetical protein
MLRLLGQWAAATLGAAELARKVMVRFKTILRASLNFLLPFVTHCIPFAL